MKAKLAFLLALGWIAVFSGLAEAKVNPAEEAKRKGEQVVRSLIEPLLNQYCGNQCKIIEISMEVDLSVPDSVAPGFDDFASTSQSELVPAGANVKILLDEAMGSVTRSKVLDLIRQHLDGLHFPVKIDQRLARFPQPAQIAKRISELRERVVTQYREILQNLVNQLCPEHCMVTDLALDAEPVNPEEVQYGNANEFVQDQEAALRIKRLSATLLFDKDLTPEEQASVVEMAKLKTTYLKNTALESKVIKFPRPETSGKTLGSRLSGLALGSNRSDSSSNNQSKSLIETNNQNTRMDKSDTLNSEKTDSKSIENQTTNSSNTNNENSARQEKFEKYEKIERVESGDAIQQELNKFKVYGLVFACSVLSLLIFIAAVGMRGRAPQSEKGGVSRLISQVLADPVSTSAPSSYKPGDSGLGDGNGGSGRIKSEDVARRFEIERLVEDLTRVFSENPKVAKTVFSRILIEEGVETTAQYIEIFGESVVMDMLRDPSLQSDLSELMEYYAKNPMELEDAEKLELLKKLSNRTVAAKMLVLGSRSTNQFEFLIEMDAQNVIDLIHNESLTVKAIVLTQCDPQKRAAIYNILDEASKMKLLTELSRIDHLPKNYIFNVANALKRKRIDNPKLNTELLPGSDVLVSLLERAPSEVQKTVMSQLELNNPDSARTVRSKLVSVETLRYLRDNQLLDVILSLRHEELIQFLKGSPEHVRKAIFAKIPPDLSSDIQEELAGVMPVGREVYQAYERRILNKMKAMAVEGAVNLGETNDRMFADFQAQGQKQFGSANVTRTNINQGNVTNPALPKASVTPIRKVS